jgi:hypothetical protein
MISSKSICQALYNAKYRYKNEKDLQQGVNLVLTSLGVEFEPEVSLTPRDRIDFLAGKLGIECKVDGTLNRLIRQLGRYASTGKVNELIVLTTRSIHRGLPEQIHGVPVFVVLISPLI